MKQWYTANELAGLPSMPGTPRGVRKFAGREKFQSRHRQKGKGVEYHISSLPKETQEAIFKKEMIAIANATKTLAQQAGDDSSLITEWLFASEREIMQARLKILDYIDKITIDAGSRLKAIKLFLEMAESDQLPGSLIETLRAANARRGKCRLAHHSTIMRWFQARDKKGRKSVAPKKAGRPCALVPEWMPKLLAIYQRPQRPRIAECIRDWKKYYPDEDPPKLRTAQRWIKNMPAELREYNRLGTNGLRAVQPFVRRTTDGLWPMDVVTVDGHLFKAYVRHPLTGRRFRPEITTYIDIATRKAVGFSAWIAESQFAIWGALREMVTDPDCGVPAMHYSDNGAYRGAQHQGVMARIGSTMMFSEAYRAQARGVIERLNSSVWVPLARKFDTYVGRDADPEEIKRALRAADRDGHGLMAWQDFIATCRDALEEYNARAHSSLRGKSPNKAWQDAIDDGWMPTRLDNDDLHDILPAVERKVLRGEVRLPWGRYFNDDLSLWHQRTVQVHIQPTDGSKVWVADHRGALICVAERDGNARPYVPDSMIQHARAQREAGRIQRLERKLDQVREEGSTLIEMQQQDVDPELHAQTIAEMAADDDVASITDERKLHAYWMRIRDRIEAGEVVSDEEREGCRIYWTSQQAQSMEELFESFGLTASDFQ